MRRAVITCYNNGNLRPRSSTSCTQIRIRSDTSVHKIRCAVFTPSFIQSVDCTGKQKKNGVLLLLRAFIFRKGNTEAASYNWPSTQITMHNFKLTHTVAQNTADKPKRV
jgi:hypothetical protein